SPVDYQRLSAEIGKLIEHDASLDRGRYHHADRRGSGRHQFRRAYSAVEGAETIVATRSKVSTLASIVVAGAQPPSAAVDDRRPRTRIGGAAIELAVGNPQPHRPAGQARLLEQNDARLCA